MADLWSWNNWVDESGAAITGPALSSFPATNLADPRVARVWRPSGVNSAVTVIFPGQRPVSVIGMFGGDTKPGDRFNLRLSSSSSGAYDILNREIAPVIDPITRQWIIRTADLGLAESVPTVGRVQIVVQTGGDVGRLWIGPADWTTRVNHAWGAEFGAVDYGHMVVSPTSGAQFPSQGTKRRTEAVKYDSLYPDEIEGPVRTMMLLCGTTRQMLYVPTDEVYSREKAAILGYLDELSPIVMAGWQRGERSFRVLESG